MDKFTADLKKLIIDLEGYRDDYDGMEHQDGDKECEAIFYGKYQAYSFVVKELNNLLKWHGKTN